MLDPAPVVEEDAAEIAPARKKQRDEVKSQASTKRLERQETEEKK